MSANIKTKYNVLTNDEINKFNDDGYLVIEDFISNEKCDEMINAIHELIKNQDFSGFNHVFAATDKGVTPSEMHDAYFLNSWNKIHFFLEKNHRVSEGSSPVLNKIGHNLHQDVPIFKEISFDSKFKSICHQLGFVKPAICQSMYIFKHPKYGAAVPPHQDASFLWTEPECRILGFWVALRDVTLHNGCLWAVPGSHKNALLNDVRLVRAPEIGPHATQLIGTYPEFDHDKYQPLLLRKGGLVIIHGYVLHKSLPNTSDDPRDVFTWHIVDTHETEWHASNWIRPEHGIKDFVLL